MTQYPGSSRTPGRIFPKGSLCENRGALLRNIKACDLLLKNGPSKIHLLIRNHPLVLVRPEGFEPSAF